MALINGGRPFRLCDAPDLGWTRAEVLGAVGSHALRRVLHGVYCDDLAPDTRAGRIEALGLVVPAHALVADEWAAWVHGVEVFTPQQRHQMIPTVLVPHGSGRMRQRGVRCRQANLPDGSDVEVHDGLRLTSALRTTSDLLRRKWRPFAMSAADAMAGAGLVDPGDVQRHLARLKGYPGIVQARTLASWIEPLAQSPGESWTRLRLLDAGFPRPRAQWPVIDVEGVQRWLDLALPERMIGVEYDGREFHSGSEDTQHDEDRRRCLQARGFRIVVARYEDVFGADDRLEREVGELLGLKPLGRRW